MSDQQDSPNHILNCNNCGTVKVIPKDAPFEYEDDFCQTCGKSYFEAPEPEEPEPEAMSDQDESPILFFECPHCEAANAIPRDAEYNEKYDNCGTCGQPIFEAPEEEEEEYDEKAMWASIREKLSLEEKLHLDNAIDKQSSAWQEVQNNLTELQTLLSQAKENNLDIATDQFSQEIEAHERELTEREETERHNAVVMQEVQRLMMIGAAGSPTPSMYDPDGELEHAEVQIVSGDNDADFYTNDSVKRFIEKRLLIAWTALKNADQLNDLAAPNLTIDQTGTCTAMDIIGQCVEEIDGLNTATINGKAIIV